MANYPMPKFHFSVEWAPGTKMGFTEVTGLTMESDVIEYREGSSPEFHKIKQPGLQKLSNITLKRGTFQSDIGFHDWMETISMNTVKRRDVTIKLLNEKHEPVFTWQAVSYTHLRAHETRHDLVCRLLLEKK